LLPILPHDRSGRFHPNADTATLVDIGAFGGNAPDDILGGQYRCHVAATLTRRFQANQLLVLNVQACSVRRVIPEIDIWRAATLMLKRYGEKALEQSTTRADELAADGDHDGASTSRRITDAVGQLVNTTPPGPVH
jgi:hypothetical protein